MRLFGPGAFAHVFAPWAGKRASVIDGVGNVGDQLIYDSTRQLLSEFGVSWVHGYRDDVDVVFLFGGGNLGGYPANARVRSSVFQSIAASRDLPVVQLPQSAFCREEWPFHRVFLRERGSFLHYPEATLAPDLALGFSAKVPGVARFGMGLFLRSDAEASGLFRGASVGDPAIICRTPEEYLALAASYEIIVTDRLHFAICGLLVGRQTYLLPNSYHKNRAVFDAWLEGLGCNWIADEAALMKVISESQ